MRKSKFAVVCGAALALAATPLLGVSSASAGTTSSNAGGASAAVVTGSVAQSSGIQTAFTQFTTPTAKYLKHMCYLDLSTYYGGTFTSGKMTKQMYGSKKCKRITATITPGGGPVWKVGVEWATWGSGSDVEDPAPYVYYTNGSTTVDVSFSKDVQKAGLEFEPNLFEEETVTAHYHGGAADFSFDVTANGSAGAKLVGAKSTDGKFNTITLSDPMGDFAVAQIRACLKKC
jgi:hypothetical protein